MYLLSFFLELLAKGLMNQSAHVDNRSSKLYNEVRHVFEQG